MRILARLALFFVVAAIARPARGAERLNILFLFADDWGRYASAYAGVDAKPSPNQVIRTPNVDRVAREGVLFRNAFVNAPSCTPCRSSLLSGRHFFQTGRGAILRGAQWDASIPSFPLLLLESGYHIGKSHKVWSPGAPADAPFGGQKFAYEKAGGLPNRFSGSVTKMMAEGESLEGARERVLAQVRGNFDAFLAHSTPDKPWLYFFGPTTTHRKWVKGSGKALWGIDPEALKGKMPASLPDVSEVREDMADYLGECQAVDAYLGVLLQRLEEAGQLERTLIVLSGDHGMPGVPDGKCNLYDQGTAVPLVVRLPGGVPGRVVDDLVRLPDLAPTFLELAGVSAPEGLYGRSLLPLLQSKKAGQIDPERNWVIFGRERHVDIAREEALPYPMRGLRTHDFLYIRNFAPERWPLGAPRRVGDAPAPSQRELEEDTMVAFPDMDSSPTKAWLVAHHNEPEWTPYYTRAFGKRPAEELYDLRKDPEQRHNVAAAPEYQSARERLAADLLARLAAAGDPRLADPVPFELPPFTDISREGKREQPNKNNAGNR
jgi:N-sulfoglucosamine sulfohydrolase